MGCAIRTPRLLETALELSPLPTLLTDGDGAILLVNREFERQFGYGRQELVGQRATLVAPDGFPFRDTASQPPDSPSGGGRRQLVARHKDGSHVSIEIEWRPIQTTDGVLTLVYVRSGDERRREEAEQRAALHERLEFERFVARLSFEFINLPDDQVSEAIRAGLARACQILGFDRGSFCRFSQEGVIHDSVSAAADGGALTDEPPVAFEAFPWTFGRVLAGELVTFATLDEIPEGIDRASHEAAGTKSAVVVPLSVEGHVVGAMAFTTVRSARTWTAEAKHRLTVIGSVFVQVLARQRRDAAVRRAFTEVQHLKDQLQAENVYLRKEERERLRSTRFVGQSPAVRRLLAQIQQVAATDATVLLRGETGTGKELLATYIHELSARREQPMVRVHCAAIPTTLIESELFGRERGAFTGSLARQVGRFELADRSTIFLDEIGDLPPDVQVKLLRVLEERTIERLGNPRPIAIDVRIVAATHRNLEQRAAEGAFREDLYYRLNVFPVDVPPLRDRVEDIPLLLWRFIEEFSGAFGKRIEAIDSDNLAALQAYPWPGNIRELRNVVERAMITTTSRRLIVPIPASPAGRPGAKLIDVEREHIRDVLMATDWRIRGPGGAAERLGMKPTTLDTRIAKLGLRRPGRS